MKVILFRLPSIIVRQIKLTLFTLDIEALNFDSSLKDLNEIMIHNNTACFLWSLWKALDIFTMTSEWEASWKVLFWPSLCDFLLFRKSIEILLVCSLKCNLTNYSKRCKVGSLFFLAMHRPFISGFSIFLAFQYRMLFLPNNQIFNQKNFSVHLDSGVYFSHTHKKHHLKMGFFRGVFSKDNTSALSAITYLLL